jgi:hypothetical protein
MTALFDLSDYQEPTHACAGDVCQVCATTRNAPNTGVKKDPRWWTEAGQFLHNLSPGDTFTADDLVHWIGLPDGNPNQVGACVRAWAAADQIIHSGFKASKRPSNHGRVLRVWRKR